MAVLTDIRNKLLRYTTNAAIADTPVTLSLQRKTKVPKAGGGHDKVPTILPPQTFRLINQTPTDGVSRSGVDDGVARSFSYILVGAYDADVAIDDTAEEITLDGSIVQYHVDGVLPFNGFETRADVTVFAKEPLHG